MKCLSRAVVASVMGALTVSAASAFQTRPSTAPATSQASTMPADAVALDGEITSVKGAVEIRDAADQPWKPAKVGMKINQGTEFRTGLRSAVQFVVGGDQTITLDRLGTITVLEAFQSRGKAKTDLGLKYGRARYDIKKTDLEHESTIRSPGSTLAIRGTDVVYEDQAPWTPRAISREGRAEFRNYRRQFLAFGGTRRAAVAADKNSTAQQAITSTKTDPRGKFSGRTEEEDELNLTLTSIGGADALAFQALQAQKTAFGGEVITGTVDVPGPLQFLVGWLPPAGAGPRAANIDLFVTDPKGQTASALNPIIGSGSATGNHFGDDMGQTGFGQEQVVWSLFFPKGKYTVTAQHQGGADAQVTIEVTQGNASTRIASFGLDPDPPIVLKPGESITRTVTASASTPSAQAQRAAQRAQLRRDRAVKRVGR